MEILSSGAIPCSLHADGNLDAARRWFANLFPNVALLAVEPDPGSAAVFRSSISVLENSSMLEAAIGTASGKVPLVSDVQSWAVRTERTEHGLPIVAPDQAFDSVSKGAPSITRIDVGGFEKNSFALGLGWLDESLAPTVEPHDWCFPGQWTSRAFQAAMGAGDFELFILGENLVYVR